MMKSTVCLFLAASQAVFCVVSYLPQIGRMLRTKSSEDFSVQTWIFLTLSFLDYVALLVIDGAGFLLFAINAVELLLCFVTAALAVRYRKKKPKAGETPSSAICRKSSAGRRASAKPEDAGLRSA